MQTVTLVFDQQSLHVIMTLLSKTALPHEVSNPIILSIQHQLSVQLAADSAEKPMLGPQVQKTLAEAVGAAPAPAPAPAPEPVADAPKKGKPPAPPARRARKA
jgi:hypothetical protein